MRSIVNRLPFLSLFLILTAIGPGTSTGLMQDPTPELFPSMPAEFPWWNHRVFYEIFVRSFRDSDGDGIGDLQGVIDSLDYLNDGDPTTDRDLGVTGIWLMPIARAASYHGYDVTDYETIEPDYGALDDLRRLVEEAHRRGIAVIVDLVINHTSREHPWFIASAARSEPFTDWYVWSDVNPGWRGPDGQQVWHSLDGRYYYALFWGGMPDLNLRNPAVTEAIYEISRVWLEDYGVDGFRMDAIKHLIEEGQVQENTPSTHAWLQAYRAYLDTIAPDALTVGEVWSTSFEADDYVLNGEMDLVFEFDLASAFVFSARQGNADGVRSLLERVTRLYPPGQFATFLTNHDQNRVAGEVRANVARGRIGPAQVAASLLLTSPGVPFLYYGEEIGLIGNKPDERIRTPMQWDSTPVTAGFTDAPEPWQPLAGGEADGVSVAAQIDDPGSLLSHYRSLIHLRNAHPALQIGAYVEVETSSRKLFAALRRSADETLLILINTDDEPVSGFTLSLSADDLPPIGGVTVLFDSTGGLNAITAPAIAADGGFSGYAPVAEMPPFATLVLRLDPAAP
jgi:glycosidase